MTKLEILQNEDPNTLQIKLYKEGMFWKAYEFSAYRFVFGIMKCKAKAHQVKEIKHNVVHVGVPNKTLDTHKDLYQIIEKNEKTCVIVPLKFEPNISFEEWKSSIENASSTNIKSKPIREQVIDWIKDFNLENKTPMECMMFLAKIKNSLHG